ncbi:nitrogen regulatory protein PII [Natronospira proteinivora]|uniref:Nitrogen regulatory protein PII n=1 Tax=Natronospira proteinivora TaxID=1807133 RepID=A0ABT1G8C4_9GAMM|nr:P-II family nitrogen regulator [Natronospira proteinivora]MCP1727566.1 nitrogen regulatory protein PII [Natronospira proteinivora]
MKLKLIIALVNDNHTDQVLNAAREAGATGSTVINNARGEGRHPRKTFFGLELTAQCDVLLFLVEEGLAEKVMKAVNRAGQFDTQSGTGMAIQLAVEHATGLDGQLEAMMAQQHTQQRDDAQ